MRTWECVMCKMSQALGFIKFCRQLSRTESVWDGVGLLEVRPHLTVERERERERERESLVLVRRSERQDSNEGWSPQAVRLEDKRYKVFYYLVTDISFIESRFILLSNLWMLILKKIYLNTCISWPWRFMFIFYFIWLCCVICEDDEWQSRRIEEKYLTVNLQGSTPWTRNVERWQMAHYNTELSITDIW